MTVDFPTMLCQQIALGLMKTVQKILNCLFGTRINFFSVGTSQNFQSFYSESGLALGFLLEVFLVFWAVCKILTWFYWSSPQCNYWSSYGCVYPKCWCLLSPGGCGAREGSDLAPVRSAVALHPAHWFSSAFSAVGWLLTWILTFALHGSSVGNSPAIGHECFILVRQVYSIIGVKEFCSWVYWILFSLEEFSHYCGFFARPEEWKNFLLKLIFTSFSILLKDAPFFPYSFPESFIEPKCDLWSQMEICSSVGT